MKLEDIMVKRISNAKFLEKPVAVDFLIELLESAVYAPNHKMREPWRFIIFDSFGKKQFLDDYISIMSQTEKDSILVSLNKIFNAPIIVAVIMKKAPNVIDEKEDLLATGALIQNFLLLLTSHGLSSFWKTPSFIDYDSFKKTLGLNQDEVVTGMIMAGYPMTDLTPKIRQKAISKTIIYRSIH